MTEAIIGVIADDLTGASDIGGILASAGARVILSVGTPDRSTPDADALIVALKSRAIPPADAVSQSLQALEWLQTQGARQIVFKVCSTFDSTPQGNIGPVADALIEALGAKGALVCPAFPANGRTVYQGHLFVSDRLLSESGMQHHPLNPMTDPDLRRWLARQTRHGVGHLPLAELRGGHGGARTAMNFASGQHLVIVDAIEDQDLMLIGKIVADHPLVVGASAIARGLWPASAKEAGTSQHPSAGQGFVLAGSCSAATLAQVEAHSRKHPVLRLDPAVLSVEDSLAFLIEHRFSRPLVATSADPNAVAAAHAAYGADKLSSRIDTFFAKLAREAVSNGFDSLVVAGGETSGAVAQAFVPLQCTVGAEIAPGVPTLYPLARTDVPTGLVLKSGNFGGPDFFSSALDALEAGR